MKKAAIVTLSLLLLTGCWDQLKLRELHMSDITGVDLDENSGDVLLNFVVTVLTKTSQGGGERQSEITELKGKSVIEAYEQGAYNERGPFSGINTGVFLISEKFASRNPVPELAFLLQARYTSINTPVVVFEGNLSKFLKNKSSTDKDFTKKLLSLVSNLEKNGIMPNVSMLHFIISKGDRLEDAVLPILKQSDSGLEFNGALLFSYCKSKGAKLSKEQVRMLMLLSGHGKGKQKATANVSLSGEGRIPHTGQASGTEYAFSAKKVDSKITVRHQSGRLPKVRVRVRMKIHVFELGEVVHTLKSDYVNRMEKKLNNHFEEIAASTIKTLQKANCDALGIGQQIRAYHPNTWNSMEWRKDYPRLSIEPIFDVQILNSDSE